MAKMMMYPKIHNLEGKAFEVDVTGDERNGGGPISYFGVRKGGVSYCCSGSDWFMVKSDIDIPWQLAPEGTTHFDAAWLGLNEYHCLGWVKYHDDVWVKYHDDVIGRFDPETQLWEMTFKNVNDLNLIPRPINIDGVTPPIMFPGEPTPEEDEVFNELDQKLNPEPDYADTPFAVRGRILERMGKLMQDKSATVHDLAKVAAEARMSVYFKIQPFVE